MRITMNTTGGGCRVIDVVSQLTAPEGSRGSVTGATAPPHRHTVTVFRTLDSSARTRTGRDTCRASDQTRKKLLSLLRANPSKGGDAELRSYGDAESLRP